MSRASPEWHIAARIFDPLGLISPSVIRIKYLLQRIWEKSIHWDDKLPVDLKEQSERWCLEVKILVELKIDRHYFLDRNFEDMQIELYIFSDVSLSLWLCDIFQIC